MEQPKPARPSILTGDGSHTLYNAEIGSHYHSVHGAVQESRHVFIEAGFKQIESFPAKVFEVGFGTGLNCLLTLMEAATHRKEVYYTAVDAFPIGIREAEALNYTEMLKFPQLRQKFLQMHQCQAFQWNKISENFHLFKLEGKLQELDLEGGYHLVYFDAFGPGVQPEMWTKEVFEKIHGSMEHGGILVTYCAKGEVKRTLKSLGFNVFSLPGPVGKREMVKAVRVV